MAILQTCCCWRTVRQGSYASAIYTAVHFFVTLVIMTQILHEERLYLFNYDQYPHSSSLINPETITKTSMTISMLLFLCSLFGLLTSILLLYALHTDNKFLLIPWIFCVTICITVDTAHCFYVFIAETLRFSSISAILFTIDIFLLALSVYSLLCVISQYQEYSAGRGTKQYYRQYGFPTVQYTAPNTASSMLTSTTKRHMSILIDGPTKAMPSTQSPGQSPTQIQEQLCATKPETSSTMHRTHSKKIVQFSDSNQIVTNRETVPEPLQLPPTWTLDIKSMLLVID